MGQKTTTADADKTAEVMAELDAMFSGPDAPDVSVPPQVMVQILARKYVQLLNAYWDLRVDGKISTAVGDHQTAQNAFRQATKIAERIVKLGSAVSDEGPDIAAEYETVIATWRAQELAKREKAA
jgi:hypothetical protein